MDYFVVLVTLWYWWKVDCLAICQNLIFQFQLFITATIRYLLCFKWNIELKIWKDYLWMIMLLLPFKRLVQKIEEKKFAICFSAHTTPKIDNKLAQNWRGVNFCCRRCCRGYRMDGTTSILRFNFSCDLSLSLAHTTLSSLSWLLVIFI